MIFTIKIYLPKVGVYPGQPPLFFILGKHEGLSQKELAKKLHIKAATITVMSNRLETAKLVERRPDNTDQRVSRIHLTGEGKKVHREVMETLKVMENKCFHNFTAEEKVLLRRFLMQTG